MSTTIESKNPRLVANELEFLELQYQVLSEKRVNHNTLLWNVPSLLFVAQAFLWTIALDNTKNLLIRCGISFFSAIIAVASYQLFERNRLMEVIDSEQMYSIEEYIRRKYQASSDFPVMIVSHMLKKRTLISGEYATVADFIKHKLKKDEDSFSQKVSFSWWKIVFIVAIILAIGISIYNIAHLVVAVISFFLHR